MKKRWNTYFKRAAVAGLSLCVLANSQLNVLATEVAGKAEEGIQSYGFWEDLFGKPEDEIETIDYIEIYREHLPVAVVGESFTDTDITLELYEDATYTAVGRWEDENGNRSGVFESQKKYYFRYVITAFEGYCFDPEIEYDIGYEDDYTFIDDTHLEAVFVQDLAIELDEIELFNAPTAKVGQPIPEDYISLDTAEDAHYTAYACWYDYKTEEALFGGAFEEGRGYVLEINVIPMEGYQFAEDPSVMVNGILRDFYGDAQCLTDTLEYLFYENITTIEVAGVQEPVLGEMPSVEGLHLVNSDAYTILDAFWMEANSEEVDFGVFEDGKTYVLNIEIEANEGYIMGNNVTAIVDGQETDDLFYYDFSATVKVEYTFKDYIPEVHLSNVPELVIGEYIPDEVEISVSEDANYDAYGYWLAWDNDFQWYTFTSSDEVFEEGKSYLFVVDTQAHEGYYFDENTQIYSNGVLADITECNSDCATLYVPFSGKTEPIHTVYVDIPEPVVGNDSNFSPEVILGEDVNYNGDEAVPGWIEGSGDNYNYVSGEFVEGTNYGVKVSLYSNEGFTFADDVMVIVNGKVIPAEAIRNYFSKYNILEFVYFFDMECEHVNTNADTVCDVCGDDIEAEEPETGESETEAPETSEPETDEPETNKPETGESETDKPETEESETNKPDTEKPATGDSFKMGAWCAVFGVSMVMMAVMGMLICDKNKRR